LDAISAYDRVAPSFYELSQHRRAYLDAVDEEILRRLPNATTSLLDAGAGDGRRALEIADRAGIRKVVLVEPSSGMRALIPPHCEIWDTRIEALPDTGQRFDAVLCLWNVLGHIPSRNQRVAALRNLSRLCSPQGLIFMDVLHRYNVAECGLLTVARRFLHDTFLPTERNGDVMVKWQTSGCEVETQGHVFTPGEMSQLFQQASLTPTARIVLNYRTGQRKQWATAGNLLYTLRPANEETSD
jgi:2-polyprenyl-3-methyl-5-hydroxy-6-metoxy-1,4-benzoquinol methylase